MAKSSCFQLIRGEDRLGEIGVHELMGVIRTPDHNFVGLIFSVEDAGPGAPTIVSLLLTDDMLEAVRAAVSKDAPEGMTVLASGTREEVLEDIKELLDDTSPDRSVN